MKRIIFLDIDGVLATPESIEEGLWGLVPARQEQFKKIIDATDAEIVLSSSWRLHTLEATKEYMDNKGFLFCDRIIGITIRAYHYIQKGIHLSIPRGVEIKQWIDANIHSQNGKNWNKKRLGLDFQYVILDDDSDMLLEQKDNFVRCVSTKGLTSDLAKKAIQILNQLPHLREKL